MKDLSSFHPHPGQKIWKINLKTQDISEATSSHEEPTIPHWHCCALNKKNAFKKFNKMAEEFLKLKIND